MKTILSDPGASYYTAGNGLRGVPVLVMDRDNGTIISARIYSNTATRLVLDVPLPRSPDRYDAYSIGSMPICIESGDLTFGFPRAIKSVRYMTVEYEPGQKGSLYAYMASDQDSPEDTAWQRAGIVPLTGKGTYRLPVSVPGATGFRLRYALMNMVAGQPFTVTHVSLEYEVEDIFA